MKSIQPVERDNYIDFLRGVAAVSIVFIHVCFHSGYYYVPELIQTLSLAVDVPFFFFLSGWSSTYVDSFGKSMASLLQIYKKYVMFFPFYIIALLIIGMFTGQYSGLTLSSLYGNLFFLIKEQSALPIVMGSMWFMPVYFAVVPLGRVIMTKLTPPRGVLIVGLGLLYSYWTGEFFHISSQTLFYLFFYFLGAFCKDIHIKRFRTVVIFCLADIGIMKLIGVYFSWDISNMQNMKFPPSVIYLLYSLMWICVTLWGKDKFSMVSANHVLCRIGRAAISFYFCQGISSSVLLFIMPKINLFWGIKLLIAFVMNLLGTGILVIMLNRFYQLEKRLTVHLKRMAFDALAGHKISEGEE